MVQCVCFHCIKTIQKSKEKLTLRHMGNFLSVNLLGLNLTSGGLHFLKVFYHLKSLGSSSGFRAIDDLPRAH